MLNSEYTVDFDNIYGVTFKVKGIVLEAYDRKNVLIHKGYAWILTKIFELYNDSEYSHKKEYYANFMLNHGLPVKNFVKMYNAVQYREFICKHKFITKIIQKSRTSFHLSLLTRIAENPALVNILEQNVMDGIENINPLCAMFQKNPKELKNFFGADWKILAKNSLTRNRNIVKKLPVSSVEIKRNYCVILSKLPSTILNDLYFERNVSSVIYAVKHRKETYKDCLKRSSYYCQLRGLHGDYLLMVDELKIYFDFIAKPVNDNWSPRRLKEEHDNLSKVLTKLKRAEFLKQHEHLSKINFTELHTELPEGDLEGVKFIPCKTVDDILMEGETQKHCVANYIKQCALGVYVVYKLNYENKNYTLGVNVRKDKLPNGGERRTYLFDQLYGFNNESVSEPKVKATALYLTQYINSNGKMVEQHHETKL